MKTLKELTGLWGVSGSEADAAEYLKKNLEDFCYSAEINKTGSVTACLTKPDPKKKTILLEAHMDRIGLAVSEITEDGFLKFKALGGVDERTLPASEVYVLGKEPLFGVIGALPPHLSGTGAKENSARIENMMIDTGYTSKELEGKASVGDPIILKSEYCELLDGRVSAGALDNRAGVCAILWVLQMLDISMLDYNIKAVFTVGEELGLLGARCIDCSDADLAIVVDVTHGRTPDAKAEGTFALGSGAAICRGPNLDFDITKKLIDYARHTKLPYTIEVAAGNTGTNAWAIQTLEQGIRCILLSIPIRYMHTAVETADTEDIKSVAVLIAKFIEGGGLFA